MNIEDEGDSYRQHSTPSLLSPFPSASLAEASPPSAVPLRKTETKADVPKSVSIRGMGHVPSCKGTPRANDTSSEVGESRLIQLNPGKYSHF